MQAQNLEELKRLVLKVLSETLKRDPVIKAYIKDLLKDSFVEKGKTEDRIEKLYEELVRLREESEKRWQKDLGDRGRCGQSWKGKGKSLKGSGRNIRKLLRNKEKYLCNIPRYLKNTAKL